MNGNGHERYEDELAAYMLGSLEPEEARSFQDHLAGCERCQARERWLRASVELLPSTVEQIEPPPALRARLIETVRSEAAAETEPSTRAPRTRSRLSDWFGSFSLRPAAALAGVLLILAAGVAGYALRGGDEGSSSVAVQPTAEAPKARGTLVRDGDRAILRVSNLPQRKGRVYEVWLVQKGNPVPSALFQVDRNGSGSAAIPGGLDRATQVMVSSEPAGGSDQPTSMPVLSTRV